jgi:hypothetical protein
MVGLILMLIQIQAYEDLPSEEFQGSQEKTLADTDCPLNSSEGPPSHS